MVGVSPITLKRWLLSGRVDDVGRDHNGWRLFREEDIRRIKTFRLGEGATEYDAATPALASTPAQPATLTKVAAGDSTKNKYRVASFFSGIGGFDLAFQRQGFEVVFQNEINGFCQKILKKNWPDVPKTTDIREVHGADIPVSDVWVAGFPCQDVSLARQTKREGLRGSKSGLFYEFARLVGEARPRFFVIENVPGLLSSHQGRDFQIVIQKMAQLGYAVGWRVLNSRYFGVPQSRQRVFIVGSYREGRGPLSVLFEPECSEGDHPQGRPNGEKPVSPFKRVFGEARGKKPVVHGLAYCLYACSARHTGTDWSRNYVTYPGWGEVRRLTPKECEGVMGFPDGWTIPNEKILDVDATDSERYHALGNAVTPPVVEWVAGRIKGYLDTICRERDAGIMHVEVPATMASTGT